MMEQEEGKVLAQYFISLFSAQGEGDAGLCEVPSIIDDEREKHNELHDEHAEANDSKRKQKQRQLVKLSEMGDTLYTFRGKRLADGSAGSKQRKIEKQQAVLTSRSERNLRSKIYTDPKSHSPPINIPKLHLASLSTDNVQIRGKGDSGVVRSPPRDLQPNQPIMVGNDHSLDLREKGEVLRRTVSEGDRYNLRFTPAELQPPLRRAFSAPALTVAWMEHHRHFGRTTYSSKGIRRRSASVNDLARIAASSDGNEYQSVVPAAGFTICTGAEKWNTPRSEDEIDYYSKYFVGQEHTNWVGTHKMLGPVAISIKKERKTSSYLAFIRTKSANKFMRIPATSLPSSMFRAPTPEQLLHALDPAFTPRGVKDLVKAKRIAKVEKELLSLEELKVGLISPGNHCKFGVLYCRGPQSENDIYDNVGGSERYLEFLTLLGDRVSLPDWPHYAGGLDTTRRRADGTYSLYTRWRDKEIMFHVATLIPYNPKYQQLERKKHIGNDMCVVVFNDGPGPFDPSVMVSKYNHIYIIVSVDESRTDEGDVRYTIAVASKEGVPGWKPKLPDPPVFIHGPAARDFLLEKLVNGERAAMNSDYFSSRLSNSRAAVMKSLEEQLLRTDKKKHKKGHKGA